tara:strand:- start:212 stop:892 length:681 start_codon:yes stop_codon:yes gene_type:complete
MSINFFKRILTSLLLSAVLLFCLFLNSFLMLYLIIIASIISFYEFNILVKKIFKNNKKNYFLSNIVSFIFTCFFIFSGYYFLENDIFKLFYVILICVFSDTGGYFIGKLIGGKKLTKISPKKTISGSLGSFLFSIFPLFILWEFFRNINYDLVLGNIEKNLLTLIFISLFLSLVCQLGDLLISYFKRLAKVKDTGTLLPGHGGLLDRIDGLIFVIPVAFILDKIFY